MAGKPLLTKPQKIAHGARVDTIIAIATPPQNGAIGIIRLSGPESLHAILSFFQDQSGKKFSGLCPRVMTFGRLSSGDQEILDECLVVFMPGPHSYTGEDVVEIHCHGNLILLKKILHVFLNHSDVRAAEPGEFTKRAFLNGRLDLAQAESVHEIITAGSEAALKASLQNLDGRLSAIVGDLREKIKVALALVEASFEFPEEDIQTYNAKEVFELLEQTQNSLGALLQAYQTSKLFDHGISVAIVGKPNVGKSSLLNALLVEERAIVTEIPGTTRDVVEAAKIINGVRFIFRDTAGLRETRDRVETAGIQKTKEWIRRSDLVLHIVDDLKDASLIDHPHVIRVLNKVDLLDEQVIKDISEVFEAPLTGPVTGSLFSSLLRSQVRSLPLRGHAQNNSSPCHPTLCFPELRKHPLQLDIVTIAKTGFGLDVLETLIISEMNIKNVQNSVHINARQHQKITVCQQIILNLLKEDSVFHDESLLAEELRQIIRHLEEITGVISNEEVLGAIFQRFCIGK